MISTRTQFKDNSKFKKRTKFRLKADYTSYITVQKTFYLTNENILKKTFVTFNKF